MWVLEIVQVGSRGTEAPPWLISSLLLPTKEEAGGLSLHHDQMQAQVGAGE